MNITEKLFLYLPLPFSKWIYSFSRQFIFKDIREHGFRKAVALIKDHDLQGDYLEFGVYKGGSLIQFYNLFKESGLNDVRIFAFDAFKGLPNAEGHIFLKGEFYFPKQLFLKRIRKAGVDLGKVTIIEGFFNASLTDRVKKQNNLIKAAIIHVDCDLYESTVDVLQFCHALIQDGTVIIFDDYLSFQKEADPTQYGEEKAFKEWTLFPFFEEIYEIGVSKAFVFKSKRNHYEV